MANALRVLMLLTDGFGGVGGIAKFNRDFLQALDGCASVERVYAQPRLIPDAIEDVIPEAVIYDRRAAGGKTAFMRRLGARAWRGGRVDLVICGHLYLLPAAWLFARLQGARLALVIHGIEAWAPSRKILPNRLARRIDTLISVSRYSAERFARWSKAPMDRAFILPNCVDLSQFKPRNRDLTLEERYGLQSSKVIMTMGRLASEERYKGFDEVIEIMPELVRQFPTVKYLIVGEGPDRPRLESKVRALQLVNKVIFTGYIPESEKVAHYNLADAYVMPSMGEGFGIVLIEAAACGVPVVGSRADGSREALLDGRLGQLIDPKNSEELLQVVASTLQVSPSRRRIDAIDVFSGENFNARVADWCLAQAAQTKRCILDQEFRSEITKAA
jgi:glycosyltransferase involved in cell wall biosynthesis